MTEITNDQLTAVAISILVEGDPGFTLRMERGGSIERMGYSAFDNEEKTSVSTEDPSLFERFVAGLPSDVVSHAAVDEAPGEVGVRIICRVELEAAGQVIPFEYAYSSGLGSLPRYMRLMVDLAEELTDEWYGSNLTLTAIDLAPMPAAQKPAATLPPTVFEPEPTYAPPPEASYEPAPAPESPPDAGYEPSPAPTYDEPPPYEAPGDPEPAPAYAAPADTEAEAPAGEAPTTEEADAETEEATEPRRPAPRSRRSRPKASRKRFAFAVVLDLMILVGAYQFVVLVTPFGGLPIGAALFFLVLTEFCLLQFLRRSPSYALLGMSAAVGEFPRVDPDWLARESLVTHIVAAVMLGSGIDWLMAWADFQAPIPFFGVDRVGWFSVIVCLLIGGAYLASGVLVFLNDLRGVWAGIGGTAFAFLAFWFARGRDFNGWLRLELMAREEARGRFVDPSELDGVLQLFTPMLLILAVVYGVGLYFTWKRLAGDPEAPPPAQ